MYTHTKHTYTQKTHIHTQNTHTRTHTHTHAQNTHTQNTHTHTHKTHTHTHIYGVLYCTDRWQVAQLAIVAVYAQRTKMSQFKFINS